VTVNPGDTSIERGNTLVVLARFGNPLPPNVDLVLGPNATSSRRIPLAKSLADPLFGGSVPDVSSNFVYHIEYAGQRTRDYQVTVFEYPRLERADANLNFPEYTGLKPKHIENTRRVSAVEGSRLDLQLSLNKPVVSARLIARGDSSQCILLLIQTNQASASLNQYLLQTNKTYELQLVDADARTNKTTSQFIFEVLPNRKPELRLASPRGDLRPSPLEEVSFDGTVWDDFGVKAFGVGYAIGGEPPKYIELGRDVPGNEKHPFHHLLRLEDLGVQPDQLISWFVWADDLGPDGQLRRTTGDLFFAEVRPFDEVFRENQNPGQEGQAGSQSQGSPSGQLADLEKQIITATWKLQHNSRQSEPGVRNFNFNFHVGPSSNLAVNPPPSSSQVSRPEHAPRSSLFFGQLDSENQSAAPVAPSRGLRNPASRKSSTTNSYESDTGVVHDAQGQALDQAQSEMERQQDPRTVALWSEATEQMKKALTQLEHASNSASALPAALSSEQAAYQTLLKLQEHEYQVSRSSRNRGQRGGRSQQMRRQLDQMELTQSENRYQTQSQAQPPETNQRREQLQVMNRLQELARRQQDLNDRLKELQTALQEARTEQERAEIERRLKRLQEEEQQMLADVDELNQRMDRAENQSSMSEQRQQLEQTRQDVQRAADAAGQGAASQALASGTRAQRQFQQLNDQMRRENSSQFADDLRNMRNQARELERQQEDIAREMANEAGDQHASLSDSPSRQNALDQLARQRERLTNLVQHATQVSQDAESSEPVLSRQLYDSVRKFTQDTAKNLQESQDQLINRGLMTRDLYDHLKESSDPDGAKLLDLMTDMLRRKAMDQALDAGQRAGTNITDLKNGVERASTSVLGDDTQALRLAEQELNRLTQELQREAAQGTNAGSGTNPTTVAQSTEPATRTQSSGQTPGEQNSSENSRSGSSADNAQSQASAQPGSGEQSSRTGQPQLGSDSTGAERNASQGEQAGDTGSTATLSGPAAGGRGGAAFNSGIAFDRLFDHSTAPATPLTGEGFLNWSDRLRDVEEMLDYPDLRNAVAAARDRARIIRQEFKRDHKKPDWAVVRLQVLDPLVQVREHVADELARRDSKEALVPLDRDPVPARYSELVRKYYEELGKNR
jgi:hypothetical protein